MSDPNVAYDGLGLEDEAAPPVLHPSCAACGAEMDLALVRVLSAKSLRIDDARARDLAARFDLAEHGAGEWRRLVTALDLAPYVLDLACPACGAAHDAVVGYGERQPARWVAVLQGVGLAS